MEGGLKGAGGVILKPSSGALNLVAKASEGTSNMLANKL